MAVFPSREIVLPDRGKLLSDYAEGEIVYVEENGAPIPFYVAKHYYESALNGTGRTLLVRKACIGNISIWGTFSSQSNVTYNGSTVDSFMTGAYLNRFSSKVKSAMGTTKIRSVKTNNSSTIATLSRKAFLLSAAECNSTSSSYVAEGTALPDVVLDKLLDGSESTHWLRTPRKYESAEDTQRACWVNANGYILLDTIDAKYDKRPAFTFPYNARFHSKTNEFMGV